MNNNIFSLTLAISSVLFILPVAQADNLMGGADGSQNGWVRSGKATFFGYAPEFGDYSDVTTPGGYESWVIASTTGDRIATSGSSTGNGPLGGESSFSTSIPPVTIGMKYQQSQGDRGNAKVTNASFRWSRSATAYAVVNVSGWFEDKDAVKAIAAAELYYQYKWDGSVNQLNAYMCKTAEAGTWSIALPGLSVDVPGFGAINLPYLSKTLTSQGTQEDTDYKTLSLPGTWQGGEITVPSNSIERSVVVAGRLGAGISIGNYSRCTAKARLKFHLKSQKDQLPQKRQVKGSTASSTSSAFTFEDAPQ